MSQRNVIQTTFDEFGRAAFTTKKSGSRHRQSAETIVVLHLQKSNYGPRYYVNVAVWLLEAGPATAPKPWECHVQTRLGRVVPRGVDDRLRELLDLDAPIADDVRREELLGVWREHLLPVREAAATLNGLRSGDGLRLVQASLVNGEGQRLLAGR
ncbi:DUF4304 domain-containing protein [Microbacterium sp. T32]|uniref:DUF4304 domain-containing protein n=1 Tax=Microbacterium sp. T32 TaxID=1776083 RepID=UPI0007AB7B2A|nr:DUF4304 domain-containing protein [Microbacterium sp. T32]KZE39580.1 hypothetical protein AVW09_04535 [Microbacterium sp. T32]